MLHYNEFIKDFMSRYDYPPEATELFTAVEKRLDEQKDFGAAFDELLDAYMNKNSIGLGDALKQITALGEKNGVSENTIEFIFILNCMETLKDRYEKAGIEEKVFWDSAADLKYKLLECMECEHEPGTFVAGWNEGFLKMTRFAYGRFQYEVATYDRETDFVTACGKVLKKGDKFINFHIPSSGVPLTDEVRLASYKEAYPHYKSLFPDGKVIFGCGSWLLYPRHREFLPEDMNIRRFMDDFETVDWSESENFSNDWRIFGHWTEYEPEKWPRDTTLRKAYAQWICDGKKAGHGFGVFVFDGEKILK